MFCSFYSMTKLFIAMQMQCDICVKIMLVFFLRFECVYLFRKVVVLFCQFFLLIFNNYVFSLCELSMIVFQLIDVIMILLLVIHRMEVRRIIDNADVTRDNCKLFNHSISIKFCTEKVVNK